MSWDDLIDRIQVVEKELEQEKINSKVSGDQSNRRGKVIVKQETQIVRQRNKIAELEKELYERTIIFDGGQREDRQRIAELEAIIVRGTSDYRELFDKYTGLGGK